MRTAHHSVILSAAFFLMSACNDATQPMDPVAEVAQPPVSVAREIAPAPAAIDAQSLTLPFSGSVSTPVLPAFKVVQTGTGQAGLFQISNGSNGRAALVAQTNGTSNAGFFSNTNPSNSSAALFAQSNGSGAALEARSTSNGRAAVFRTMNPTTLIPTVEIWNSGGNPGLFAMTQGDASAGYFTGAAPSSPVLYAQNTGSGLAFQAYTFGGGEAGYFQSVSTTSTRPVVSVLGAGPAPVLSVDRAGTGPLAVFRDNGANKIRFSQTGKGFFNGGTQTGGADIAEAFEVEGDVSGYRPGDVLVISERADRRVRKSSEPYSTRVIGVYATKPGVLLTEREIEASLDDMVPVGVVGVIPTRVSAENGAIRRGDLLVSARTPGHAMRADPNRLRFGMVLGKALEEFAAPGSGTIRVLVNVK
jgi:trimeric autotransporter adhesin